MTARHWLVIAAIAVIGAGIWLWPDADKVETPAATSAPRDTGSAPHSRTVPALGPRTTAMPRPAPRAPTQTFDASKQHTADPCTAPVLAEIPSGFESVTVQGITVAWMPGDPQTPGPTYVPYVPTTIAHLAGGLLEEVAVLTGTARRSELAIIIYRDVDHFRSMTHSPAWAGGLYDGGAVHVPASPGDELGVSLATLRHEIMHSQLHVAIGCMPFWLNEGLAVYSTGAAPLTGWLEMLRAPGSFDLRLLRNPAEVATAPEASRMYRVSHAMVVHILHRGGQPGLQQALRSIHGADPEKAMELWEALYPRVDYPAIVETIANKVFGLRLDQVGPILDGPLCCHGLGDIHEISCRPTQPRTSPRVWFDTWTDVSSAPRALCKNKW